MPRKKYANHCQYIGSRDPRRIWLENKYGVFYYAKWDGDNYRHSLIHKGKKR